MKCKSGLHEWIRQEDAEKCCNGFRRVLVIGNIHGCNTFGSRPLPGGTVYGYTWEKVKGAPEIVR